MTDSRLDPGDLVEHLAEGLQVVGPDFTYLYVNRVAAEYVQRSPEELVGKTMIEGHPGIEDTDLFRHVGRILESGGSHRLEEEFRLRDGSSRWLELRIAKIPQGVVILSIDVTERKRLESQLHRAQRVDAIGQLAGGFAHDFNNLLTIVHVYGAFIRDGLEASDPMRDDALRVLDAAQRGSALTQKMLALARQMPTSPRAVDVSEALDEVGQLLERVLGKNIVLTVHSGESVGRVMIHACPV